MDGWFNKTPQSSLFPTQTQLSFFNHDNDHFVTLTKLIGKEVTLVSVQRWSLLSDVDVLNDLSPLSSTDPSQVNAVTTFGLP